MVEALVYMVRESSVEDEDIFKTCLEFWSHFAKELYNAEAQRKVSSSNGSGLGVGGMSIGSAPLNGGGATSSSLRPGKHAIFEGVLHALRILMIDHMAKPEEVIIVEDDNGEIVREMTKDTEVIAQYKTMRETIMYLTNLNYEDTEGIMLEKLDLQVAGACSPETG